MSGKKILIVDDEARMRKLIRDFLEREGYQVEEAADGEKALQKFYEDREIALILLDVMMPGRNGWQVCEEIRQSSRIPVVMLTARSEERDELKGFELGVDEYIAKPFSPRILMARIKALLQRTEPDEGEKTCHAGIISLNSSAHVVTVNGEEIMLSFKEFELLEYFMDNQGIALKRERILDQVWEYDYFGDARTIDTHVKKLRSKLGDAGDYIHTVWGVGYKFEVEKVK